MNFAAYKVMISSKPHLVVSKACKLLIMTGVNYLNIVYPFGKIKLYSYSILFTTLDIEY